MIRSSTPASPRLCSTTSRPFRKAGVLTSTGMICILLERQLGAYLGDDLAATLMMLICAGLGIGLTHPMIAR